MSFNPEVNLTEARYPNDTELMFPVLEETARRIMANTSWIYDTPLDADYNRWFEVRHTDYDRWFEVRHTDYNRWFEVVRGLGPLV